MSLTRSIVKEILVNAPVDVVWRALTDPEELIRWFPADARVDPWVGGAIWLSWGEGSEGTGTISAWDPGQRVAWTEARGLAVDFRLETRTGGTVVRLVQSGFGAGADWDNEFSMTNGGWSYFLEHLRWYLEKHRGVPRDLITWREPVPFSKPEAYARVVSALDDLHPETLVESRDTQQLGLTVASLNNAIAFVEIEPARAGARAAVWLSTYGLAPQALEAARTRLDASCRRAFAS